MAKTTNSRKKNKLNPNVLDRLFHSAPAEWHVQKGTMPRTAGKIITNIGTISSIELPNDWEEGVSEYNRLGQSVCLEFHPANDPAVRYFFFYRGLPVDPLDGQNFTEILRLPPHVLSVEELEKIKPLLRGKENSNDFEILSMQSADLNGVRIIALTGIYIEDQKPMMSIFINGGLDGRIVQEIEYQAPMNSYVNYLPIAQQSMQTITWK